jgi:hypothetical protein
METFRAKSSLGILAGFADFDITIEKRTIFEICSQFNGLPNVGTSCSSALDLVHKQDCRVGQARGEVLRFACRACWKKRIYIKGFHEFKGEEAMIRAVVQKTGFTSKSR